MHTHTRLFSIFVLLIHFLQEVLKVNLWNLLWPNLIQAGCPCYRLTNSIRALKNKFIMQFMIFDLRDKAASCT